MQLIKSFSTLKSATGESLRTEDPNNIFQAVEAYYNYSSPTFLTCISIVATLNPKDAITNKDDHAQGVAVMRDYHMCEEQFVMVLKEKQGEKRGKRIWSLFYFCRMIPNVRVRVRVICGLIP